MFPQLGSVFAVLAQEVEEPDPSLVTPGSLGLAIVLMLGLAVVLLFKSMNKQLKRIDLPEDRLPDGPAPGAGDPRREDLAAGDGGQGSADDRNGDDWGPDGGPDGSGGAQSPR